MDDALLVGGVDRLGDLARDRARVVERDWPERDAIGQRLAVHQFQDQRPRFRRRAGASSRP